MAVVAMRKLTLCAPESDKEPVLRYLQRKRVLHVEPLAGEDLTAPALAEKKAGLERARTLIQSALRILDEVSPPAGGLLASLNGAELLGEEEWAKRRALREKAQEVAQTVQVTQRALADATAHLQRAQTQKEALWPWLGFGVPLDLAETRTLAVFFGALPGAHTEEELRAALAQQLPDLELYDLKLKTDDPTQTPLLVYCLKEDGPRLEEVLRKMGFARPLITASSTAEKMLADLEVEITAETAGEARLRKELEDLAAHREELRFAADDLELTLRRLEAEAKTAESAYTFFVTGYVPADKADKLKEALEAKFLCEVELEDPAPDEEYPILLRNNPFSGPTETVVASYGLPTRREIDPTFIMSLFYYVLFGMMLSDAGYGLILAVGCGVLLLKFPRMKEGTKKMLTMLFGCGISTTIWGFLFGSFFGNAVTVIGDIYFGAKVEFPALWFVPLEDPMRLLVFSFALGVVHLFTGLGIKGYLLIKEKKWMDFFAGVLSWYLLLIGLIIILLPSDIFASLSGAPVPLPEAVVKAGQILAIVGAVIIVLFTAYEKKNFGLRIALGAYELYGATSWLSDVLSYSRLLALGLATGVVASVINNIGQMLAQSLVGKILFPIIFLGGHALNLAINALGSYVHTNRLQFVEFFGKFYEGGGKAYEPLTADSTTYYQLEDE